MVGNADTLGGLEGSKDGDMGGCVGGDDTLGPLDGDLLGFSEDDNDGKLLGFNEGDLLGSNVIGEALCVSDGCRLGSDVCMDGDSLGFNEGDLLGSNVIGEALGALDGCSVTTGRRE